MSIVSVQEIWHGRSGAYDKKGVRTYNREFQVICDNLLDGPLVASALGIPALYFPYITVSESDFGAIVQNLDVKNDEENPFVWIVSVKYSSEPIKSPRDEQPGQSNDSRQQPELRPWVFTWSSRKYDNVLDKDYANVDVVNAAGVPFDPPVMVSTYNTVLKIQAYKSYYDFSKIKTVMGATNNDTWQGFAPRELLVTNLEAETQFDNGVKTWKISVELEINYGLWNPVKFLNAGTAELDDAGDLVQINDKHGQPITHPIPLDEGGAALVPGGILNYLEFQGYREIAYKGGLI